MTSTDKISIKVVNFENIEKICGLGPDDEKSMKVNEIIDELTKDNIDV